MEEKEILQQKMVPLNGLKDVGGYIAYISLDFLDTVFNDIGLRGQPEKQQEYLGQLQEHLAEEVLNHDKRGLMMSWSWIDKEGQTRRAIELVPVAASAQGLQIVTPDVTGYQELRDKMAALENENFHLRQQMREIGEHLKVRGLITEHAFRAYFEREPGGLVEQFEEEHKEG